MKKRVGPLERGGKSAKRREKRETNTIKMRGPLKAIVRSQNGEAQGRVDWKRDGWPDAKFEATIVLSFNVTSVQTASKPIR